MKFKLAIAQPVEGPPEVARVCYSVQRQMRSLRDVIVLDNQGPLIAGNVDIVRARDRFARVFLWETDATHLLWWDEDVLVGTGQPEDLQIVQSLVTIGHDCVGVPYRRKKDEEEYPYRIDGKDGERTTLAVKFGCVPVDFLAFGFMMTSRKCVQSMWDAYKADRWYFDVDKRKHHLSVSMFGLQYTDTVPGPDGQPWRTMLSEDYSFCRSYRAIGGRVQMFVGEGSPVGHIGSTVFRGTREGLVRSA